jgi:hypothetical protein
VAQLAQASTEADDRFAEMIPPPPKVLFWLPGDSELGFHEPSERYNRHPWYGESIDALRSTLRRRRVDIPVTGEDRVCYDLSEDARVIGRSVPWPEAQARADEIVRVFDEWDAARGRALELSGHPAADEAHIAERIRNDRIRRKIVAFPAKTLADLLIKAQVVASYYEGLEGVDAELAQQLEFAGPRDEALTVSIIRDLVRLGSPAQV